MPPTAASLADASRLDPQRYFNLFRLLIAGFFLVAGRELGLGEEAPRLFMLVALSYLALVLMLGFPDVQARLGLNRLISLQVIIDILALTGIMWISGGYRSGMPVLMMVYLAAAGLVAEGRMVIFFAAVATVTVLGENAWRAFGGRSASEFLQVGIVCIGFFAIAFTARLLARRAKANESLAMQRGEALSRQQAINERIIRDMQDGVIVLSEGGRVRQANPRASILLGADLGEGLRLAEIDTAFKDCCGPGADRRGVLRRLGPAGKLLRCRAAGPDDTSASVVSDDTVVYLTDFEEIQKHVQQLKLAALGRLTASMAHEIRNPLSAVTQAADLLGEEKRADVQVRLLRIINDNARRIERTVRDVLALGKRDQLMREALPLRITTLQVVEEFGLKGEDELGLFAVDIDEGLHLAMDRAHLHQVLSNLLYNARRHCSGAPGSIRIFAHEADEGGDVVLHVVDDGAGISDANRVHLFDPFFTTDAKGTGLGLYIARELAEANDASLDFIGNEPGAHFSLTGRRQP
ncbi:MAG TPA: PAS domain-containing sensor histidine kinase [Rhodocyclaceae bacterium]|nr:PAS domain-containing sensor histidine kinase [Rhodocyclaceae bacterium]